MYRSFNTKTRKSRFSICSSNESGLEKTAWREPKTAMCQYQASYCDLKLDEKNSGEALIQHASSLEKLNPIVSIDMMSSHVVDATTSALPPIPFTTEHPIQTESPVTVNQLHTAGYLLGAVTIVSLVLNVYTCFVVLMNWRSFIKYPFCQSNMLCMFLSLADILLALLVGFPTAIRYLDPVTENESFIFYGRFAVSLDRTVHILRPLRYKFIVSHRVTVSLVCFLLALPVLSRVIPNIVYLCLSKDPDKNDTDQLLCLRFMDPDDKNTTHGERMLMATYNIPIMCYIHVDTNAAIYGVLDTVMQIEVAFFWMMIGSTFILIVVSNIIIITVVLERMSKTGTLGKNTTADEQKSNLPYTVMLLLELMDQENLVKKHIDTNPIVRMYCTLTMFISLLVNPWLYPLRMETIRKFFPCFKKKAEGQQTFRSPNTKRTTMVFSLREGNSFSRKSPVLRPANGLNFNNLCSASPTKTSKVNLISCSSEDFTTQGYVLFRSFLKDTELKNIQRVFGETDILSRHGYKIPDSAGRSPKIVLWNAPGSDVTGMLARCQKVVETAELLLGGREVYHYHSKLVVKEARVGGRQEWHQDYGYWYNNGLLTPDCLSVFIPLDRCTKENGCLQIIAGSHHCGRIEHTMVAGQTGADKTRVDAIISDPVRFSHHHVEMSPGDALFFHGNLLHMSEQNDSEMERRALILAYNRADNSAATAEEAKHHPMYRHLDVVPNCAVEECENYSDFTALSLLIFTYCPSFQLLPWPIPRSLNIS
eukprot:sb/3462341/